MASTTTLLVLILALVGALIGWWSASREDAPKANTQLPPPPTSLRDDEDPAPSQAEVDDLNARISETDELLSKHETLYPRDDHDRPTLSLHLPHYAPDPDAVDLLRSISRPPPLPAADDDPDAKAEHHSADADIPIDGGTRPR